MDRRVISWCLSLSLMLLISGLLWEESCVLVRGSILTVRSG